jgi:hypothetical protein
MGSPEVKAIAVTIYIGVWGAIAAAVIYLASETGHSLWVGAGVACVLFFLVNGSVAYRFRARQLRQQGKEPPSYLVYLFYPKPINFREPIALPRAFRVLLGIVILIGGAFLVLAGTVLLFTLDLSKVPHPVGAVIGLVVLASVGVGSLYVGVRLMVMKNDEPMLKGRKSGETKSSSIGAA